MAEALQIKSKENCRWDCVSLGEVMLRFDPGFGRVRTARSFQVWEGGGEYNVARAMRKCWGKRASVVTALPKNDLGWLVEDFARDAKVRANFLGLVETDDLGDEDTADAFAEMAGELGSWQEEKRRMQADLPAQAIKYVRRVEELVGCPIALLSTSPEREDTILVLNPFEA